MLRTILTPVTTHLNLSIPKQYLGKKIEILLFSEDEALKEKPVKKNKINPSKKIQHTELLQLSEETLSTIWDTKENEIWDKYYRRINEKK